MLAVGIFDRYSKTFWERLRCCIEQVLARVD